jgi:seryl-tRNA synthetase
VPRPPKRHPAKPPPGYEFMTPKVERNGWTAWQQPVMAGYQIKCCGCGLVHEVEFRTYRVEERYGPLLPTDEYRVQMRMKRK